jgi:hypothetical protein
MSKHMSPECTYPANIMSSTCPPEARPSQPSARLGNPSHSCRLRASTVRVWGKGHCSESCSAGSGTDKVPWKWQKAMAVHLDLVSVGIGYRNIDSFVAMQVSPYCEHASVVRLLDSAKSGKWRGAYAVTLRFRVKY